MAERGIRQNQIQKADKKAAHSKKVAGALHTEELECTFSVSRETRTEIPLSWFPLGLLTTVCYITRSNPLLPRGAH
jgi:hypothetical protein